MSQSALARIARVAVRTCLKPVMGPRFSAPAQRRWAYLMTRTLSVPLGVRFEQTKLASTPTEKAQAKGRAPSGNAILFLHGGAYLICSPVTHRSITGRLAKLSRATVFAPDYRLAPEHPFPAALEDALSCYQALLEQGYPPEKIILAGDSAGGGLALALCLTLREKGLRQPARLALISPWADQTLSRLTPIANDALLSEAWLAQGSAAYRGGRPASDPFVSPLYADLSELPPTLIQAASEEILRDDSRRLAEALDRAGVSVTYEEFPLMWHDFQLYAGLVPEATQAVAEIARFALGQPARVERERPQAPVSSDAF